MAGENPTYRDLKVGKRVLLATAVSQSGDGWSDGGKKVPWLWAGDAKPGNASLGGIVLMVGNRLFSVHWKKKGAA